MEMADTSVMPVLNISEGIERMSQFKILYDFLTLGRETKYRKEKALRLLSGHRVIQSGLNTFMVESKRYLDTLGIPSKYHIVLRTRPDSFHLRCDCRHTGVYPSPYDLCAHSLAV